MVFLIFLFFSATPFGNNYILASFGYFI